MNKETRTLQVVLIIEDVVRTKWMQAAGVFEKFKRIAKIQLFSLEVNTKFDSKEMFNSLRNGLATNHRLIGTIYPTKEFESWFDPEVLSISDGTRWITLDSIKESYGLK